MAFGNAGLLSPGSGAGYFLIRVFLATGFGFAADFVEFLTVVPLGFTRMALARTVRLVRRGRFHPTARSARNDAGISATARFSSVTARAAASARSARTSAITLDGRRALAAWTRFVSRMTNMSRSGSIHIEVPVKPV